MSNSSHIRHYHRHFGFSYPVSIHQRLYSFVLIPLLVLALIFIVFKLFGLGATTVSNLTFFDLFLALVATFARLLIAYVLALIVAIPLALLITHNALAERIFLPLFDIIQSIPVLAFFPVIIVFFIHYNFLNGAAIFILFLSMVWNIVFSLVGGIRVIPSDIKSAAKIFNIKGLGYIDHVLLPAVVPYIITGSLLAWAQGWNIIIVAEVLHTYIPGATATSDLFGIGSALVNAAAAGQQQIFIMAIVLIILGIGFINFFVWQKLLRYAEKFKFE